MNILGVAAKNVGRNKARSVLTVLGTSVAVIAFVLLQTVLSAWNIGVEASATDRIASRHKVSFLIHLPVRYADDVRAVPGIKAATFAKWFGGKNPNNTNDFFASLAVESKTYFTVYDEMKVDPAVHQQWLENRKGAILGDVLAKRLKVKPGDRVTLSGTLYPGDWQFDVVGIYAATRQSVDRSQFIFHYAYLNETLNDSRRDTIGWTVARIEDPARSGDITAAVDAVFEDRDIQTITMSEKAMNLSNMAMLSAVLSAMNIVSFAVLLIMMLILGNTIAMGVRERTNEYGVLRAIGFHPKHVAIFILGEALTIGLCAGILGLALSYPIVELGMGRFLEENMANFFPYFRIEKTTMIAAIGCSMGLALAASLLPAYRASKLSVTDALRRIA